MIDERYVNGKIYKIVCNETGEVYYGSTIIKLKKRINNHTNNKNCSSRQILNRNNYYYELIENYSCNNKKELETRERWYIENNECINKFIPTRTKKEYRQDNKETMVEKRKNYYENNKEKLLEQNKLYYDKNKEKKIEQSKLYAQNNKEKRKEYQKEYYNQNKEKINEKLKEKITCDICGSIISNGELKRHQRTKKCLDKI
tara:strand:+ start:91 stop:693 length:603 start_codon:yes stop_codon:yes gene_type:complete